MQGFKLITLSTFWQTKLSSQSTRSNLNNTNNSCWSFTRHSLLHQTLLIAIAIPNASPLLTTLQFSHHISRNPTHAAKGLQTVINLIKNFDQRQQDNDGLRQTTTDPLHQTRTEPGKYLWIRFIKIYHTVDRAQHSIVILYLLLNRPSKLNTAKKLLIYKACMKPITTYARTAWGQTCRNYHITTTIFLKPNPKKQKW